jgi:hypothetical protein
MIVTDCAEGHRGVEPHVVEDQILGFGLAGGGDDEEVSVFGRILVTHDGEQGQGVGVGLRVLDRVVHHDLVLREKVGTVVGVVVHGCILADQGEVVKPNQWRFLKNLAPSVRRKYQPAAQTIHWITVMRVISMPVVSVIPG